MVGRVRRAARHRQISRLIHGGVPVRPRSGGMAWRTASRVVSRHDTLRVQNRGSILGNPEARGRALIDKSLLILGDALHNQLEPQLVAVFGSDWAAHVRPRHGRFARRDLASYAQCLLGAGDLRDTRHIFRAGLGVDMSRELIVRFGQQCRYAIASPILIGPQRRKKFSPTSASF